MEYTTETTVLLRNAKMEITWKIINPAESWPSDIEDQ